MDLLVTYDVYGIEPADQRRRDRIAKMCERYGNRTQYSVFECRLSNRALAQLTADLQTMLDPARDSVNLYRFERELKHAKTSLGKPTLYPLDQPWIL